MVRFENYRLGEDNDEVDVDRAEEHRIASALMAQQTRHSMDILSRELDPAVYDTPEFVEAAKRMVLNGVRPRVRIIVFNPEGIVRRGHRLVELALTLTSFFELRKAGEEHKNFNGALFVADTTGYIQRLSAERYEGKLNFNNRGQSQVLVNEFEEMWARSMPDINLRRLSL